MVNYTKRVIHGTSIIFLFSLLTLGISYLLRLVLAKFLPQEDYGLFYGVWAFVMFIASVKDIGLPSALVKFVPQFQVEKKLQKIKGTIIFVLMFQLFSSFFFSVLLLSFSNLIATHYFHSSKSLIVLKLMIVVFFLSSIETFIRAIFLGFQSQKYFAFVEFTKMSAALILAYILLNQNLLVKAPIYAYMISYVLLGIIFVPIFFSKVFPGFFVTRARLNRSLIKSLFGFGAHATLGFLGGLVLTYTDTILLTYFTDFKQVALYNVAVPTVMLLAYFSKGLSNVVFPLTSELWAKKHELLSTATYRLQKYTLLVTLPAGLALFMFPTLVLRILFGESYTPASNALRILSVGAVFYASSILNTNILLGVGKPEEVNKIILSGALLNLVLNLTLIPIAGIEGAATATTISFVSVFLMSLYKVKQIVKSPILIPDLIKTLFAGFVFVATISTIKRILVSSIWIELFVSLSGGLAVYVALITLLKVVKFEEISDVLKEYFRTK